MAVVSKLPADERRAVTVEAVLKLAEKHNPSDITTAAIAQHMHLTQGALFRHFPNKDAIWQAVMEWVSERLIARLEAAARTATSSLDALETMFMTHTSFAADHPGALRILLGELQREMDTPAKRTARVLFSRYGELLRSVIEQGKSKGDLTPETDAAAAASLFIGMVQGLVLQSLLTGDVLRIRAHAPGVFAIYRRGLEKT
jgi:TetR/AcrR family transcriptional regulator